MLFSTNFHPKNVFLPFPYLLEEFDAGLEIHAKVLKDPVKSLLLVLLLLEDEHVMVEELLELLIGKVDAQLVETVFVKDFEPGNVQHAGEGGTLLLRVQRLVTLLHEPLEQPVEVKNIKNGG